LLFEDLIRRFSPQAIPYPTPATLLKQPLLVSFLLEEHFENVAYITDAKRLRASAEHRN
jgi:hypothetical protein